MKRNIVLFGLILVAIVSTLVYGATNYVNDGDTVVLTWATTSPSANAPVVKTKTKAFGGIIGVALNGSGTAAESVTVKTSGVFNLAVHNGAASICVGDYVYCAIPLTNEICTATLSATATGLIFGQALDAIATDTESATIRVRLVQPSHL